VFDPLAVALVVAFNNAIKIDKGIVKKEKVIRKRELYDEVPEEEEELTELQKTLLMDVESEEVLSDESNLDLDGDGIVTDEEREMDLDGDGKISEEELKIAYENGGWKSTFEGKPYYHHPWFDWNKKERWINNRQAIEYWLNYRGGSQGQLDAIKKDEYPDDFTTKTY
jgi:hypothetical protein